MDYSLEVLALIGISFVSIYEFNILLKKNPITTFVNTNNLDGVPIPYVTLCPWPQPEFLKNRFLIKENEYLPLSSFNISNTQEYLNCYTMSSIKKFQGSIFVYKHFLGICFTCKPMPKYSTHVPPYNGYFYYKVYSNLFNFSPNSSTKLFIILHLDNQVPKLDGQSEYTFKSSCSIFDVDCNFVHITALSKLNVKSSLNNYVDYNQCYTSCLKKYFLENFADKNKLSKFINLSEIFPKKLLLFCKKSCEKLTFLAWRSHVKIKHKSSKYNLYTSSKSSVRVLINETIGKGRAGFNIWLNNFEESEENETNTVLQLINDLGGLLGITLGVSLLSLGHKIVNYIF